MEIHMVRGFSNNNNWYTVFINGYVNRIRMPFLLHLSSLSTFMYDDFFGKNNYYE